MIMWTIPRPIRSIFTSTPNTPGPSLISRCRRSAMTTSPCNGRRSTMTTSRDFRTTKSITALILPLILPSGMKTMTPHSGPGRRPAARSRSTMIPTTIYTSSLWTMLKTRPPSPSRSARPTAPARVTWSLMKSPGREPQPPPVTSGWNSITSPISPSISRDGHWLPKTVPPTLLSLRINQSAVKEWIVPILISSSRGMPIIPSSTFPLIKYTAALWKIAPAVNSYT